MKIARQRKIATRFVAVLMLAGLMLAGVARAQVLEQVPDDALVVVKIKNLSATSDKLGKTLAELGLSGVMPGMENPLAMAQEQLGIKQGLQADGDAAVIFRDPSKSGETPDKSMMVLIPVSDFNAFVANFDGAKAEGEVTEVQMPHGGGPGFIAQRGGYAALSPSKSILETKPTGILKIAGAATNRELASHDVTMFVNMQLLRPQAQGALMMARMQIGQLEQALPQDESITKLVPVLRAFLEQTMTVADAFVRDANSLCFSLNISDGGFNGAFVADFGADSYCGQLVSGLKDTDAPLLKGLPAGKYLFLGGYTHDAETTTRLLNEFAAPILKELDAMGDDMKPAHDYHDALISYVKAVKSASFGLMAPSGAPGASSMIQVVSVAEGDAKAMKDANERMVQDQQAMMKALKLPGSDAATVTLTPNAKTVDGVTFDTLVSKANPNATDPASRRAQMAMNFMYGPGGLQLMEAEVGGRFLMTMGLNDEAMSAAIAAAKTGASPVSDLPTVKTVASHLPAKRLAEVYIPLGDIASTALSYMQMFGAGMNVNIPADLPPIGISLSTDGPAYRTETYVSTDLVKAMVQAGTGAYGKMHGGGHGNPPATGPDKDDDDKGQ